jgi:hypothetical protein
MIPVDVKEKKATVAFPSELPEQITAELAKKVSELTGLELAVEVTKK